MFQVRSHLPFLSAFLETQTFSTFIDDAILKMNEPSVHETPFEFRLRTLKERFGESLVRTPTYEPTKMIDETDKILIGRLSRHFSAFRSESLRRKLPKRQSHSSKPDAAEGRPKFAVDRRLARNAAKNTDAQRKSGFNRRNQLEVRQSG
jgi:hypothetical protein